MPERYHDPLIIAKEQEDRCGNGRGGEGERAAGRAHELGGAHNILDGKEYSRMVGETHFSSSQIDGPGKRIGRTSRRQGGSWRGRVFIHKCNDVVGGALMLRLAILTGYYPIFVPTYTFMSTSTELAGN